MIASIDGATAVAGVSSRLGGPADQALFAVLRSQADVVVVAAGTVRAEHYGPLAVPMAVLSRSGRLDWDSLFTAAITPPIVITVAEAPALEHKKAADLADVIIAGERDVDLAAALGALAERGYARVLAEGGPTLNGQLAAAGLLDELCLTVSPLLAGGRCQADPGRPGPAVRVWLADPIAVRAGRIPFPAVPPAIAGPTLPGRVRRGGPEGELPREDVRSVADRHQMLLERGLQDPDDGLPADVVIWSFSTSVRRLGSGRRAASVYAAPAPTMKLVVSAGLLDAGRRTISRARRPGHDPAGCLHRRRDHLAAAGHGQRAGPGPCPGRRRDDHLAGSRHGALARAGQCITWTGPAAPPGHVPPWQPRPCGLSGHSPT